MPEADTGDCHLLQDHHEAIFFCNSHGLGKMPILPNPPNLSAKPEKIACGLHVILISVTVLFGRDATVSKKQTYEGLNSFEGYAY